MADFSIKDDPSQLPPPVQRALLQNRPFNDGYFGLLTTVIATVVVAGVVVSPLLTTVLNRRRK